jgi:hypothetical protein
VYDGDEKEIEDMSRAELDAVVKTTTKLVSKVDVQMAAVSKSVLIGNRKVRKGTHLTKLGLSQGD